MMRSLACVAPATCCAKYTTVRSPSKRWQVIRGQIDRARHLLALSERSVTDVCMEVARRIRNSGEALRRFIRQTSIMRIKLTSIMVGDQDKALKFYTEVLGFVKKRDIP
jgi:hypothetical protein